MKFFIDTEFLEGKQDKKIFGIKYGETKPTIDLISIGIVSEDGREYYAISKDFNLDEAWNRYDLEKRSTNAGVYYEKVYWIRENVLRPIFEELAYKEYMALTNPEALEYTDIIRGSKNPLKFFKDNFLYNMLVDRWQFTYRNVKRYINEYGKSNKQISEEVCSFIDARWVDPKRPDKGYIHPCDGSCGEKHIHTTSVEFYTYYGAYDHVVFCWLFGKMIDLPKGFPMYTNDLRHMLVEKAKIYKNSWMRGDENIRARLVHIRQEDEYPVQPKNHIAIEDARWNKRLYEFINTLD